MTTKKIKTPSEDHTTEESKNKAADFSSYVDQSGVAREDQNCNMVQFWGMDQILKIKADYDEAIKGAEAFVRMGLRLVVLKNNCAHGEFQHIIAEYLSHFSKRTLYNAKQAAERILEENGYDKKCVFELDDSEMKVLSEEATGKTRRMLIGEAKTDTESSSEKKYRDLVMPVLKGDLELLEEWTERIESGESSWYLAWQALVNGPDNKKGNEQQAWFDEPYFYIVKGVKSAAKWCEKTDWEAVPDEEKSDIQQALGSFVANLPPTIRAYVASLLK